MIRAPTYLLEAVLLLCTAASLLTEAASSTPAPAQPANAGRVVARRPGTWYSNKASAPTVIRFSPTDWRMWAYGRETNFSGAASWSFGRSGYFIGTDGVHWEPVPGPGVLGSVMDPRRGTDRYDGGATGISDVKYVRGVFFALITGVRDEALYTDRTRPSVGPFGARGYQKTRIGIAASRDGIHWARCDAPPAAAAAGAAPAAARAAVKVKVNVSVYAIASLPSATRHSAGAINNTGEPFGAILSGGDPDLAPLLGHLYADGYDAASDPIPPPPPRGVAKDAAGAAALQKLAEDDCKMLAAAAAAGRQFGPGALQRPGAGGAPLSFDMLYNSIVLGPGGVPSIRLFSAAAQGHQLFVFNKTGPFQATTLVPPGSNSTSFDALAISGARKARVPASVSGKQEWLVFYEATDRNAIHSIGVARSADGVSFFKEDRCGGAPGGPALAPRLQQADAWDAWQTGTPFPLVLPNGTIYLYYVGMNNGTRLGAGGGGGAGKSRGGAAEEGMYGAEVGLAAANPDPSGAYCNFRRVTV